MNEQNNPTHAADRPAEEAPVERQVRPYATSVTWRSDGGGYWQQWHDDDDPMPEKWDDRPPDEVVHVYSQAQVREMLAEATELLAEMTEGRDYYMHKSRTLKASQEALRTAARAAFVALRAEGAKHGRLCEMLDAALKA